MPPYIDKEKCNQCGTCVDHCQSDVFYGSIDGEDPVITYPYECWHCNACVHDCPTQAVSLRIPVCMLPVYK